MCEIDLGDPCEVWVPSTAVARKPHRCDGCRRVIQPGEKYHKTFARFEGEDASSKHCRDCGRDMDAFSKAHEQQLPHPTGLVDAVQECIDEGSPNEERRWKAMLARIRARGSGDTPGSAT